MNRTPVESQVARCLMEPRQMRRLLGSPSPSWPPRELERLRLFGGFITKVQHNDLWDHFPATRQWLHRAGIELAAFAEYRMAGLNLGGPKPSWSTKVRNFVRFLEGFLPGQRGRQTAGLLEVLRHEFSLWEISGCGPIEESIARGGNGVDESAAVNPPDLPLMDWGKFQKLVPRFRGQFRLGRFEHDPVPLIQALENSPGLPRVKRRGSRSVVLGYWKPPGNDGRLMHMTAAEAAIFSAVHGKRSVRTVIARARANGLEQAVPRQFRDFFCRAAGAGMITLSRKTAP